MRKQFVLDNPRRLVLGPCHTSMGVDPASQSSFAVRPPVQSSLVNAKGKVQFFD